MDLSTTYLGMNLRSPLVVAANPLSGTLDGIKQMEDAGAAAIVLFSLFEEQVRARQKAEQFHKEHPKATLAQVETLFPTPEHYQGLDEYLLFIQKAKQAVNIPIIASLNCMSFGTWTDFAATIENAGADALELNVYFIPTDADMTSEHVEGLYARIVKAVRGAMKIPIAIKLTPFFTNLTRLARELDQAGANGIVLFNRFYQPDLDPKTLSVKPSLNLSTEQDSRLALHWIAILHQHIKADLAATGGIHAVEDVVKMLMAGAKVAMMASVLLRNGIDILKILEQELSIWLDQNSYDSVATLQGAAATLHSQNPTSFERSQYLQTITSYKPIA